MDQGLQRTNHLVIKDRIPFLAKPYKQKPQVYRDLYLKEGLSAAQIAERLGCSKTTVLERLRAQGIRNPDRRIYHPPYGFSKLGSRLVPNRAEMRICRLVVSLHGRKGMSMRLVALELEKRGFKNRHGKVSWALTTVYGIFKRWNGKI